MKGDASERNSYMLSSIHVRIFKESSWQAESKERMCQLMIQLHRSVFPVRRIVALLTVLLAAAFLAGHPTSAKAASTPPSIQPLSKKTACTSHAAHERYNCVEVTVMQVTGKQFQATGVAPLNIVYGNCPKATLFTSAFNTNDAKFAGTYVNNCGPTLTNGMLHLHVDMNCSGFSGGGDDVSANLPSPWYYNTGNVYSYAFEGRCVECVDGDPIPVGFPPFTLTGTVDIQGRAGTTTYWNDPSATSAITMNNSPAYSLPCY